MLDILITMSLYALGIYGAYMCVLFIIIGLGGLLSLIAATISIWVISIWAMIKLLFYDPLNVIVRQLLNGLGGKPGQ